MGIWQRLKHWLTVDTISEADSVFLKYHGEVEEKSDSFKIKESPLPEIGEEVSVKELMSLAVMHEKVDIAKKLQFFWNMEYEPLIPFVCDGCTCWPDSWKKVDIYPACFWHDVRYWIGGNSVDRLFADGNLMLDVLDVTKEVGVSRMMFTGVRVAGGPFFQREFSWGFVWDENKEYSI